MQLATPKTAGSISPSDLPEAVPVARYRFRARLRDGLRLPEYAGSLLRGQFGSALRSLTCMTRQPSCKGCPLQNTCPYSRIFEAVPPATHELQAFSAIPNAYIIEPPSPVIDRTTSATAQPARYASGQELTFHMVTVGHATEQLPLIIYAWQRALASGLTRHRSRADLIEVQWVDADDFAHVVWRQDEPKIRVHDANLKLPPALGTGTLRLFFDTPLRLQRQGHPIRPEELEPRTLVVAIARRVALTLEFHANQPQWGKLVPALAIHADRLRSTHRLCWFDWTRYSSRQRREMTLGGVVGPWTLYGLPDTLTAMWPWLWLGQWLHVGKNATFGMGRYTLEHRQTCQPATALTKLT